MRHYKKTYFDSDRNEESKYREKSISEVGNADLVGIEKTEIMS